MSEQLPVSEAWPFVIVQARVLLAPAFMSGARGGHGRLLDAARTDPYDPETPRSKAIEFPEAGPVTLCFRRVPIQGAFVGRQEGVVRDEATRPLLMTEGIAVLGQHAPADSGLLERGRDQVLAAVRAYIDDPSRSTAVRPSRPVPPVPEPVPVPVPVPVRAWRRPAVVIAAASVVAAAITLWLIVWLVIG